MGKDLDFMKRNIRAAVIPTTADFGISVGLAPEIFLQLVQAEDLRVPPPLTDGKQDINLSYNRSLINWIFLCVEQQNSLLLIMLHFNKKAHF